MHMLFTEKELAWIKTDIFGWPVKSGCPEHIYNSILRKKEKINNQIVREGVASGKRNDN